MLTHLASLLVLPSAQNTFHLATWLLFTSRYPLKWDSVFPSFHPANACLFGLTPTPDLFSLDTHWHLRILISLLRAESCKIFRHYIWLFAYRLLGLKQSPVHSAYSINTFSQWSNLGRVLPLACSLRGSSMWKVDCLSLTYSSTLAIVFLMFTNSWRHLI